MASKIISKSIPPHKKQKREKIERKVPGWSSEIFTPKHVITLDKDTQQLKLNDFCTKIKEKYNQLCNGKDFVPNGKFTLVMPISFGSERRKTIPDGFQDWADNNIMIPMLEIIFGKHRIDYIKSHLMAFKIRTEPVSENADHYGKPIYHWHVDAKIGIEQPKNNSQIRITRILINIGGADEGSTLYLKNQPRGFKKQTNVMEYLKSRFKEVGVSTGKLRELFETPDEDVFRAKPGQVFMHKSHSSHGGYPIHAEANPSPKGRTLLAIDLKDVNDVITPDKLFS